MSEERPAARPGAQTLRALNEAALAISRNLDLDSTLQQIVESARELLSARYAALGVFNSDDELETFIHAGLSDEKVAEIGELPQGRGLLGAVLESDVAIRVDEISEDPRSVGFPPHHPEMSSFLGCPITVDDRVLGNLYLAEKLDGGSFTEQDEELLRVFSSHAAAAIRNARLFQASLERTQALGARNRELRALYKVAQATGTYADLNQVVSHALDEVLGLTNAEAGEVYLLESSSNELVLHLHRGQSAEAFYTINRFPIGVGFPGRVAETGETITTSDLANEARYLRDEVHKAGFKSFVCVPLKAKGEVLGTLNLASKTQKTFDERDLALLEAIGHLIGTAVENARLYEEVGRLAVIEERARIGMDLHDGVIQSIYAVGLTLETIQQLTAQNPEKASEMLDEAIEGLNDAIRDIRNFILDLRPRRFEGDLTQGLARLVREFQANT
ncbi:MAG: GAF domain-containing protein, partial [Anaerolineales bacterium]|nr:GAF domain-containing protein [Anaerolineales bacterium]